MKGICATILLGGILLLFQGCLMAPGMTIQFSGIQGRPDQTAKVKSIEGKAQIRATKSMKWEELMPDVIVPPGAEIRTESKGTVQLEFSEGSTVTIDSDSVVGVRMIESPVVGDRAALNVTLQVFEGRIQGSIHGGAGTTTFQIITPDGNATYFTPAPGQTMSLDVGTLAGDQLFVFPHPTWGMHPNFSVNDWNGLLARQIPEPFPLGMVALAFPLLLFFGTRRGRRDLASLTHSKSSCQAPRFLR